MLLKVCWMSVEGGGDECGGWVAGVDDERGMVWGKTEEGGARGLLIRAADQRATRLARPHAHDHVYASTAFNKIRFGARERA